LPTANSRLTFLCKAPELSIAAAWLPGAMEMRVVPNAGLLKKLDEKRKKNTDKNFF